MTISSLPTPPSRAQSPELFADAADAFLSALPAFGTEANALATEVNAAKVAAENAQSAAAANAADAAIQVGLAEDQVALAADQVSLATAEADAAAASAASALNAPGTSAFATDSLTIGLGTKALTIQTGKAYVVGQFVIAASAGNPGNYMIGQITAYSAGTGSLVLTVTATGGNGTYSDWNIALTAPADASTVAGGMEATTTATSFTLSTTAKRLQVIAFTADGQSVTLPDATLLPLGGELYVIENAGEYPFVVRAGLKPVAVMLPGDTRALFLKDNTTSSGVWVASGAKALNALTGVVLSGPTLATYTIGVEACALDETTALIAYQGPSSYLNIAVVTRSGASFTVGTPVVVASSTYTCAAVVALSSTVALLAYVNDTDTQVYIHVITVSGGVPSLGTALDNGADTGVTNLSLSKISSTQAVLCRSGASAAGPTLYVLTVSGSTVTAGSVNSITSAQGATRGKVVMLSATSGMFVFEEYASNYELIGYGFTISGTTITTGSGRVLGTANNLPYALVAAGPDCAVLVYSSTWDTSPQLCYTTLVLAGTSVGIRSGYTKYDCLGLGTASSVKFSLACVGNSLVAAGNLHSGVTGMDIDLIGISNHAVIEQGGLKLIANDYSQALVALSDCEALLFHLPATTGALTARLIEVA